MSKYIRSDARAEVEPGWMSFPHLTRFFWLGGSWTHGVGEPEELCDLQSSLGSGLCSWAAFWNGQGGTNSVLSLVLAWALPHCHPQRRMSWVTPGRGRNGKNSCLHLKKLVFSSWAAAEGGFEVQGWDTVTAPGLYLFSELMAGLLPSKKYKS